VNQVPMKGLNFKAPGIAELTRNTIADLLVAIDTPHSLAVFLAIKYGETPVLNTNPIDYNSAEDYRLDAQADALIKKNPFFDFGVDVHAVAVEKFFKAEKQCESANKRISEKSYRTDGSNLGGIIYHASEYLARRLGSVRTDQMLRLGPGSSYHCRGLKGSIPNKLENDLNVLSHTQPRYYHALAAANPLWVRALSQVGSSDVYECEIHTVDHNRFSSVLKDWRGNRGICIEPGVSVSLQLAAGARLRQLLLEKEGVDLNHVPDEHAKLAKLGSKDGSLATIDLSSASDTISYNLVKALLPYDWFTYLDNIRAKRTKINGRIVELEKFSSMGNGFTFELQTWIFRAICYAVTRITGNLKAQFSVFGDDIIVSHTIGHDVCRALESCGFTLNTDKTFVDGLFKESCGNDFFDGQDVRPIFFKELNDDLEGIYQLANRVRGCARRSGLFGFCDGAYFRIWCSVVERIPHNLRFFGPKDAGDNVIHASRDEFVGSVQYTGQCLRIRALKRCYSARGRGFARKPDGALAFLLHDTKPESRYSQLITSSSERSKGQIMRQTGYVLRSKARLVASWPHYEDSWI